MGISTRTRVAVAAAVAAGVAAGSIAFTTLASAGDTSTTPPPVPQIVNPDGTINTSYFQGTYVWEPPGYQGPHHYVSPKDFDNPGLSPTQIGQMTQQQLNAYHIVK